MVTQSVAKSRKAMQSGDEPRLISAKDVTMVLALPFWTTLGWFFPDRLCLAVSRALVWAMWRVNRRRYAEYSGIFHGLLGGRRSEAEIDSIVRETASLRHFERFLLLRFYRPWGWQPRTRLEGREHIEAALKEGHGVILWMKPAAFADVMTKVTCHQAGYDAYHLSRHTHGGFSVTRFGLRFLNTIRTRIERRNLAQRVMIVPEDPRAAIDQLVQRLSENRVVSITVGAEAKRVTQVPFLDSTIPLAGGAANLAIKTGAPILPIFTERRPDGSFLTTVEPPLRVPAEGSQGERITAILSQFPAVMEPYFLRLPEQYDNLGLHRTARRLQQES